MTKPIQLTNPFRPGVRALSAADLEAMRQELLNAPAPRTAYPLTLLDEFWGVLDDTDQTPYTDERYWVMRHSLDAGATTDRIATTALDAAHARYRQITASNLPERLAGTHLLPQGTPVWVQKIRDASSPPVEHYFFTSRPGISKTTLDHAAAVKITTGAGWATHAGIAYDHDGNLLSEDRFLWRFPDAICPIVGPAIKAIHTFAARVQLSWAHNVGEGYGYFKVELQMHLITEDFDPDTVNWATQPDTEEIPQFSNARRLTVHTFGGAGKSDDVFWGYPGYGALDLAGFGTAAIPYYGLEARFVIDDLPVNIEAIAQDDGSAVTDIYI